MDDVLNSITLLGKILLIGSIPVYFLTKPEIYLNAVNWEKLEPEQAFIRSYCARVFFLVGAVCVSLRYFEIRQAFLLGLLLNSIIVLIAFRRFPSAMKSYSQHLENNKTINVEAQDQGDFASSTDRGTRSVERRTADDPSNPPEEG